MKKQIINFSVIETSKINASYARLTLQCNPAYDLNGIEPGQFVEIAVPQSGTLLRRPISVHDVDAANHQLILFVRDAGASTHALINSSVGDVYSIVLPLGNGFPTKGIEGKSVLLIGGGIGIAPLLYYAKWLKDNNTNVKMAFGAQNASMFLAVDEFENIGQVCYATNDGSKGVTGFVTELIANDDSDIWCVCGPMPMMKAVAAMARTKNVKCYVSLENTMACGLGACLCCVEKTVRGNRCVCTDGPVFDIEELTWQ